MVYKILPPEEAKKRARANVAEWLRQKEIEEKRKSVDAKKRKETPVKPDIQNSVAKRRVQHTRQTIANQALRTNVRYGHLDKAKEWLLKGADPNSRSNNGHTVLILAALSNFYARERIAQMLIDHGADVNGKDEEGKTALMHSIRSRNEKISKILIENGADLNAKDRNGMTALMLAAKFGIKEFVELLVMNRADVNAKDNDGMTALSLAIASKAFYKHDKKFTERYTKIINLLKKHGATE